MKSAAEFQRRNSRRTWTVVIFLVALLLVAMVSISYFVAMVATQGGTSFMTQVRQAADCGQGRMVPLAGAIERYRRGKGRYPERVEDVFPVYLPEERTLHCPIDPVKERKGSSFTYHAPEPGKESVPVLECPHHGPILLQVRAQGAINPGRTTWELKTLPRPRE